MNIRKSLKKGLPFSIFLIFLAGCVKEFDVFTPAPPDGNIAGFFSQVQTTPEQMVILADLNSTIVTEHRTIIQIPAQAFEMPDGTLAEGSINFEYLEIYDRASLILNNLPTVSGGRLLETNGVFKLNASQNGQELKLATDKKIKIQIPNSDPRAQMELFYGSIGQDSMFNWKEADENGNTWTNVTVNEWAFQDSLENWFDFGYEFFTDSLSWINVDIFVDTPEDQKTTVCVELPEIYTNKNTIVFMVFNEISSVVAFSSDSERMLFCEPYGLTPIGSKVTFVVLSQQGDEVYHLGIKETTIRMNHSEFIVPEETPLQEILDILRML